MLTDVVRDRRADLLAYAALCTATRAEAEAVLREALVRAFSGRRRPRSPEDALVTVRAAVRTVCAARADATPSTARLSTTAAQAAPAAPAGPGAPASVTGDRDPAGQLVDTRAALAALTPRQRLCVVAHHVDDLPVARIAEDLRMAEAAVRRDLVAGTATLRRLVGARVGTALEEIRAGAPPAGVPSQGRAS